MSLNQRIEGEICVKAPIAAYGDQSCGLVSVSPTRARPNGTKKESRGGERGAVINSTGKCQDARAVDICMTTLIDNRGLAQIQEYHVNPGTIPPVHVV